MSAQQQRQVGNAVSEEALVSNVSSSIQPCHAQMLQHHILVQQGLSSAVSTTETHAEQRQEQYPIASATATFTSIPVNQEQTRQALTGSDLLMQFIQQRQALSNAMSATENNIQQLLPQLFVAPARNESTSSQVSPDMMLQGLEGPGLLQLLQRIQSQQDFASAAPATVNNSQPQLPVALASDASTSSPFSQEQIFNILSSDPDSLQEIMQNIQSRQGLSSTAVATEDLASLVSRVNAVRSTVVGQSTPSIRGDRADAPATASVPPSLPSSGISMGLPDDNQRLSEYQVNIRQHLEIFEAKKEDVRSNIQGRKRPVFLGQAGIRCRHCSNLKLCKRGRGAVYYPVKLSGMYQAAQNMASSHLSDCCSQIQPGIKQRLRDLRHRRETARGGKEYWAESGRAIGLYETEVGLRLLPGIVPWDRTLQI
jgi:hypothetical protein